MFKGATFSRPSGPNARSMIDVKPSSATVHFVLSPQRTFRAPGSIRQTRDSPRGAGKPFSSPT